MTALRNASDRTGITPSVEFLEGRRLLSGSLGGQFVGNVPTGLLAGKLNNRATLQVSDTSAVRESGKASVALYVSTTPDLQRDAVLVGTVTRNLRLWSGQSAKLPFRFATPSTLADGSVYLVAKIGGTGDFADAGNNSVVVIAPNAVALVHPFVDLSGQVSAPTQPVVATGVRPAHATMRVVVTNRGTGIARGSLQVEADVSARSTFDGAAVAIGSASARTVAIKPGGSRVLVIPLTIPTNVSAGSYTVFANINPAHSIGESDYTNNVVAAGSSLVVFSPTTTLGAGRGAAGDGTGTSSAGGSVAGNGGSHVTAIHHGPGVTAWRGHNGGTWAGIVPPDPGGTDDGSGVDDSGSDNSGFDTPGGDSSGAGSDGGGDSGAADTGGTDNGGGTGSDFTSDPGTDPGAGTDFGGSGDGSDATGRSDSGSTDNGSGYNNSSDFALVAITSRFDKRSTWSE